ncbi:hypothetical protein CDL15_Pgr007658 [Punica granatum]|uniref:Uncharacterized protein n=1 Tax=Punica granatum TaxID=22663 RepID=A0A218XA85_PUNGR|nr:hypothetical protein CDL15_Pgr007658 [Punica granatum]PKI40960.1 hypothetical protein CRG98_038488 [Punica granatum]
METRGTSPRFSESIEEENESKGGGEIIIGPVVGQSLRYRYQNSVEDDDIDFEDEIELDDEMESLEDNLGAEISIEYSKASSTDVVQQPQFSYSPPKSEEDAPLMHESTALAATNEYARCRRTKYLQSVRTPVENLAQLKKMIEAEEVQTPDKNFA